MVVVVGVVMVVVAVVVQEYDKSSHAEPTGPFYVQC